MPRAKAKVEYSWVTQIQEEGSTDWVDWDETSPMDDQKTFKQLAISSLRYYTDPARVVLRTIRSTDKIIKTQKRRAES